MRKNIYIIIFDVSVILMPIVLYFNLSELLLEWINVIDNILLGMIILTILGALTNKDESMTDILENRKNSPTWWFKYDLATDILFVILWVTINPLTSFLYAVSKALVEIRIAKVENGTKRNQKTS